MRLLHRFTRILDLALSGLDDGTIDLAGAHGDAGEADFVQAADRVDIATVFATDEDFELRIDGASVSDESADHLLDCRVDGDERMTLEEFLVDVERQEAVGVVAGKRDKFGGGIQNGLDLHLGDFGVGDGHTDRAVAEHRVLFLFQAAVVREELVKRSHPQKTTIAQTDGHSIAVHLTYPPAALRLSPPPSP